MIKLCINQNHLANADDAYDLNIIIPISRHYDSNIMMYDACFIFALYLEYLNFNLIMMLVDVISKCSCEYQYHHVHKLVISNLHCIK